MRGKENFFRKCIKLAGGSVTLDRGVESLGVEYLEPRAKPRKLTRGELLHGFLDIFGGGHPGNITLCPQRETQIVRRQAEREFRFGDLR